MLCVVQEVAHTALVGGIPFENVELGLDGRFGAVGVRCCAVVMGAACTV